VSATLPGPTRRDGKSHAKRYVGCLIADGPAVGSCGLAVGVAGRDELAIVDRSSAMYRQVKLFALLVGFKLLGIMLGRTLGLTSAISPVALTVMCHWFITCLARDSAFNSPHPP
jgi:hypothetical protein